MTFRFNNLRRLTDGIGISIPLDEEGYIGRECPKDECLGYFKIKLGTGLKGDDLPCFCPYCGHEGSQDTFWTPAQLEYLGSIAVREVGSAIFKDLKQLEFEYRPSGLLGVGISMKVEPGRPLPIRRFQEKTLETKVTCVQCSLDYAVYGVFGFCPDCSEHNSVQILTKNIDLVRKQVDLATSVESTELRQQLIDDALENCVSAFDAFGREACRVRAHRSVDPQKAGTVSFQNLERAVRRIRELFGVDLNADLHPADWNTLRIGFMRRHLLAHRAGVVDQQYLDETKEPESLLGRRLTVNGEEVLRLAALVESLGRTTAAILPNPR